MSMPITSTEHLLASFDNQVLYAKSYRLVDKPRHHLFFVHGLAGDSAAYDSIILSILKKFPDCECIAYDLRGHGLSSRIFPHHHRTFFDTNAHDLQAVIKFFKAKKPILIGHSLGGMVIQEYLNLFLTPPPAKIALICSAPQVTRLIGKLNFSPDAWYALLRKYTTFRTPVTRKRTYDEHLKYKDCGDYSPSRIASDIYFTNFNSYALMLMSVLGWENEGADRINSPSTLYIYGTKDRIIMPSAQKRFISHLSKVRAIPVDTTHNSIVTNPSVIAQTLKTWLKSELQSK